MTARKALDAAIAEVVDPVLQAAGFTGAPLTWRRCNASGDWVVVTVELAGGDDLAQCSLALAAVPAPWLSFMGLWLGRPPAEVQESIGLYRDRVAPVGWAVRTHEEAAYVATLVASALSADVLPRLDRLQDRTAVLASLRAGDLGMLQYDQYPGLFVFAEAVLISEDGPSDRLDDLLAVARRQVSPERKADVERYAAWIHERAQEHRAD